MRFAMKPLAPVEATLIAGIDQQRMLARTLEWAAVNSGTGNLAGLAQLADMLANAFAALPGEVTLREPAAVTAVDAQGREVEQAHGRHLVCSVRPQADRRFLLTGHMDTVYPADHPFQSLLWLDQDCLNGPGTADMKGGIAVIVEAILSFVGMSVEANIPAWGVMIADARKFMFQSPWGLILPICAIVVTVLAFNLLGDGLRRALDPKLRGHGGGAA